jgi:predicted nucleic acid-binding protein
MSSENPANKVVITDTTCFIILDKIGVLYLLGQVFSTVITTPEIALEFGLPLPGWVTVITASPHLREEFETRVDPGEASAIALAIEIHPDYVILDDLDARKFAEQLRLSVKGTGGVLLLAKQRG